LRLSSLNKQHVFETSAHSWSYCISYWGSASW